jgi:hypothetical protein
VTRELIVESCRVSYLCTPWNQLGDMSVRLIWSETTTINTTKTKDLKVQGSSQPILLLSLTCECNMRYDEYDEVKYVWGVQYAVQGHLKLHNVTLMWVCEVWVRARHGLGWDATWEWRCSSSWNAVAGIICDMGRTPSFIFW